MVKRQLRRSLRTIQRKITNLGSTTTNFFRSHSSYNSNTYNPPTVDSDDDDAVFEALETNETNNQNVLAVPTVQLPCEFCHSYFAVDALMNHQRLCEQNRRSQRRRPNATAHIRRVASDSGPIQSATPSAPTRSRSPSPTEGYPIPDHLQCPITMALFHDPVVASDGHTYERAAIVQCIRTQQRSPITRQPLSIGHLNPSLMIKKMADDFRDECKRKRELFRFRLDIDLCKDKPLPDSTRLKNKQEYYIKWLQQKNSLDKTNTILVHATGPNAEKLADVHRQLPVHPHLVRSHGNVEHSEAGCLFVQEHAPLFSLTQMMKITEPLLSLPQLDLIFHQIANGLECLAQANIVHGHLNSNSILIYQLDSALENTLIKVKGIGDYLIFERPDEDLIENEIAPEILANGTYSEKSDVFAFGAFARQVYPAEWIDAGRDELFEQCLAKDPQARPTFHHILTTFSQWLNKEQSEHLVE